MTMFEKSMVRKTSAGRVELLNFPVSEKVLISYGKDRAIDLANEILRIYRVPATPEEWKGKVWVHIATSSVTYHIPCVSVADAKGAMDSLADIVDSGKCIRRMLRDKADYASTPRYTVIPAAQVTRITMSKVKEVE